MIEAEVTIRLDIEKVVIFGCANDRLVIPSRRLRGEAPSLSMSPATVLGVVDNPGASWAAAAQIAVDRRERKNASAGNLLPDCDRAGIHGADSKHSISLCHRFRCETVPCACEKTVLSGAAGRSAQLVNDLRACLMPGPEITPPISMLPDETDVT